MTTLVWFRQDLRLADNPALAFAAARGDVTPVYVLDDETPGRWKAGGASRWWLHHSLAALREKLGGLVLLRGETRAMLREAVAATGADAIVWNRCYEPYAVELGRGVVTDMQALGVAARSFNAALINEPWEVKTLAGKPYTVFTPYLRAARQRGVATPVPAPSLKVCSPPKLGLSLDDLGLAPKKPDWAAGWEVLWRPGEDGARDRLLEFVATDLAGYATLRDRPDRTNVSRLSAHLHFGEISPRQAAHTIEARVAAGAANAEDARKFTSELTWREFNYNLLYHFPTFHERNWKQAFDAFPTRDSPGDLHAWQKGLTGYPFVDAGMRQLWATGFIHNRARMVAASFLVKHLRIDWRQGEAWFWDTLVDADLANNASGWQWVMGSGADAAPFFRIFNPVEQGRKFDPDGAYVRRWCPELAALPTQHIHAPFLAPADILGQAGVVLGQTYPRPLVEHAQARAAALAAYEAVRQG